MSWESFYLIMFLVGFLLSLLSVFGGMARIPHLHMHGHLQAHGGVGKVGGRGGISPFNFATLAAFLAWFGGTGYLLERYSSVWVYLGLLLAVGAGLCGAAVVFWFLMKLMEHDKPMDPIDYEMVGVLGKVASPIRAGGTGEVIYSRDGSRKAAPARSDDGTPIARDCEVVVTRFEKGVAYVRPWDEMRGGY